MSKEWLWWLGEFGLAATVAVVAGFVTKDVPISILYGLFVGTVFFVLRQNSRVASQFHKEVTELEDKALNLPVTLSYLEDVDPYLKQIVRSERSELLRLAKGAADGDIVLRTRHIVQIMNDMHKLPRRGDRVVALSTGVRLGTPQWDITRQINFELADKGVDFTRIFIELTGATPEDKKRLKEEMDREKERLHVRFVKESRLPLEARKNMFLIFDKIVGYPGWIKPEEVSRGRIAEELRICARRDELEKAQELAETIIKLSEEYK